MPARNPSAGLAGVDGVLVVTSSPVSSSRATTSVNVPPVSMPTLIRRARLHEVDSSRPAAARARVQTGGMRLVIRGRDLPGASRPGYDRIGVGAAGALRARWASCAGDAASARWETEVSVVDDDFRGPAVHGKRGERFVYLTWGDLSDGGFDDVPARQADARRASIPPWSPRPRTRAGALVADVVLTDEKGGPRCARVDPPAVTWSVEAA